jgi:DNA-binding transcriptional LysR family regulator
MVILMHRLHVVTQCTAHSQPHHQLHTIAANDLQRDLLLPGLLNRLQAQAPGVTLRVVPSDVPSADMLRAQDCQLVISPRPPDATDIKHKRLFTDSYRVFYDPQVRKAPRSLKAYEIAEHITVVHQPRQRHTRHAHVRHLACPTPTRPRARLVAGVVVCRLMYSRL